MLSAKTIKLRLVEEIDAEFILSLRLRDDLNQFLNDVGDDVEAQREWIRTYKTDERLNRQFYFIIERLDGTECGTVRLYDFRDGSFSWGSWILNENKTKYAAIESAMLVYQYGFGTLGFDSCHFEVMKGNTRVVNFHKKFGAEIVSEDADNYYFNISKSAVEESKKKFEGLL